MPRQLKPTIRISGPGSALGASNPFAKKQQNRFSKKPSDATTTEDLSIDNAEVKEYEKLQKQQKSFETKEDILDWVDESDTKALKTGINDENLNDAIATMVPTTEHNAPNAAIVDADNTMSHENKRYNDACRAIGFDCRSLRMQDGVDVCDGFRGFVQTMTSRGIAPDHIATTVPSTSKLSVGIQRVPVDAVTSDSEYSMLKPLVYEQDPNKTMKHHVATVPKELSAKYSWKIYGEMVNVMVKESFVDSPPLDVMLVTTDLAIFCDTSEDGHRTGVVSFLNRIAPLIENRDVGSIHFVVAETGRLTLADPERGQVHDRAKRLEGEFEKNISLFQTSHLLAMTKCIHAIKYEMSLRTTGYHQGVASDTAAASTVPMDLRFTVIEHCSAGYKLLSRQILRKSVVAQDIQARIVLELPELLDGTQFKVAFDASYRTMPFALDSISARILLTDLKALEGCKLELVQALPHASIDLSLMFGVPITVQSGIFASFATTQEMQVLTRSLFRCLEKKGLALLLQVSASSQSTCKFHNLAQEKGEQSFVLVPKVSTDGETKSGLLFGYAQADDFFLDPAPALPCLLLDYDIECQYMDYIERAMDVVTIKSRNPLEVVPVRIEKIRSANAAKQCPSIDHPPTTCGDDEQNCIGTACDDEA
ncbi:hypothetical protein MPSEU_000893300 [Mayamaea pseudoterrestris]|nr:hypothetical protein MPSEU_000893300 [Mayamaea pseudoterrestris]